MTMAADFRYSSTGEADKLQGFTTLLIEYIMKTPDFPEECM